VAEDGVLEMELGHAPSPGEHSDRAYEHEVDEGSQGSRMLPASAVTAEPSFGPPQAVNYVVKPEHCRGHADQHVPLEGDGPSCGVGRSAPWKQGLRDCCWPEGATGR
jgi:hypothetical protein